MSKRTAVKLTAGVDVFSLIPSVTLSGARRMSKHNKLGLAVTFQEDGVVFTVNYSRGSQKFSFPILVTDRVTPAVVAASLLVPGTLIALTKWLILVPAKLARKKRLANALFFCSSCYYGFFPLLPLPFFLFLFVFNQFCALFSLLFLTCFFLPPFSFLKYRKIERLRKETAEQTALARVSAQNAIALMLSTVNRKREFEQQKRGLVIIYACYGNLDHGLPLDGENEGEEARVIDVTIPLNYLVEDSKLILHDNSKSQLLGFYDPCVGEEKRLYIQYLYRDKLHEVTILDDEKLGIPLACKFLHVCLSSCPACLLM